MVTVPYDGAAIALHDAQSIYRAKTRLQFRARSRSPPSYSRLTLSRYVTRKGVMLAEEANWHTSWDARHEIGRHASAVPKRPDNLRPPIFVPWKPRSSNRVQKMFSPPVKQIEKGVLNNAHRVERKASFEVPFAFILEAVGGCYVSSKLQTDFFLFAGCLAMFYWSINFSLH